MTDYSKLSERIDVPQDILKEVLEKRPSLYYEHSKRTFGARGQQSVGFIVGAFGAVSATHIAVSKADTVPVTNTLSTPSAETAAFCIALAVLGAALYQRGCDVMNATRQEIWARYKNTPGPR